MYRTGSDGARVVYRDGSTVRHAPFSLVMFQRHPLKIEGRLFKVSQRGLTYEAPALESQETKSSIERGIEDLAAGRFKVFDTVDSLIEDLQQ